MEVLNKMGVREIAKLEERINKLEKGQEELKKGQKESEKERKEIWKTLREAFKYLGWEEGNTMQNKMIELEQKADKALSK